ncbi:hypothetical protein [Pseudomonas sp. AS2.8]|uniref:hypothetical protein n=1 Tax=Pseudomonas sp. AS2.8 TaxID=2587128 RepID=UPI00160C9434|nr:hypothetical protein [Pseudomonas sp. AS2.8]MBB2898250.1 hypothetical protein [Pseudomonas sp. AS2.8]
MKSQIKEKLKASGIHFAMSAFFITAILAAIRYFWYPEQLFYVMRTAPIFIILAATDIAIGPLLTFIAYQKEKETLRKDLLIILAIQLGALCLGIKTLAEARPVWIVYNYGIFDIVRANDISTENINPIELLLKNSWLGPKLVSAKLPESNHERKKILFDTLAGKPDISKNPIYFLPIEAAWSEIKSIAVREALPNEEEAYLIPVTGSATPSIAIIKMTKNPNIKIIKAL